MKRMALLIFIGLMLHCAMSYGQETYQWVDEKGTVYFTDDLGQIPEKYRDQVLKKKTPSEPPALSSTKLPKDTPAPQADVEKKDILGRGEDWWRGKAMEWKGKLAKAQKDYETAYRALKAKDKELEGARFKPDSFKRKLQAEIKLLELKVDEHKKQYEEAKNMLEKVLPRQAEEYRADPSWVRVE